MTNEIDLEFLNFLSSGSLLTQIEQPELRVPGVTTGCYSMAATDENYHRKCIGASSSALKKLLRSPAHYKAYKAAKDQDSPARRFGRAVHAMCLEPETFDENFGKTHEDQGRTMVYPRSHEIHAQGHA